MDRHMRESLDHWLTTPPEESEPFNQEDAGFGGQDITWEIEPTEGEYHVLYIHVVCPFCGTKIWGTWKDIDSGLRKHLDNAECNDVGESDT